MYCLSKLQIFVDSYALLTHGRDGFDQWKTENKTKIDPLVLELQASFEALPEPDLCALGDDERLFFYKFVLVVTSTNIYRFTCPFDIWQRRF